MNNYITLDGKKYKTIHKQWTPGSDKPATVRRTLLGTLDVTYGPGTFPDWQGKIEGPVTPIDSSWGSIADLRLTIVKMTSLSMTDHYGVTSTVHVLGPFAEESRSPVWDAATNMIYVKVRIVKQ
jgi:hypothetical protein